MIDQENIHNQSLSKFPDERAQALKQLMRFFSSMPDKQQAWNDLHRLTNDKYWSVKSDAASALGSAFSQVPDKQQAWNDLIKLITNNKDKYIRSRAASALDSAFSQVPDKQQAFNDLHGLTNNKNSEVRLWAASALGSAFSQVPDKQQAWNDLQRLTKDTDYGARYYAASALCSAFSQVPDKQQAWNDLHGLINNNFSDVRSCVVSDLGSAFSQVPNKQQLWNDLVGLTNDEDRNMRISSNHSLGRVCIFKASQANNEEDYKKQLEKAIYFFEKSAHESFYELNPSKFCLPFYRSFHTIIFKKQEAKGGVDKYLKEAKAAIGGSKGKKQLFEAVENLAEALKEVQNLENIELSEMKGELNFYRKYCENAAELMKDTDEKAPYVTGVLRKGLPILDRNLKGLIEEIQEKAKIACQISQGTATEEIACSVSREIQKWEIDSQEEMTSTLTI